MDLGLRGKQVCITGGSKGIGLAVARAFAAEGAEVAILARNREIVEAEAGKIEKDFGVRSLGIRADVTRTEEIEGAAIKIEREFGGVDILINNAGTGTEERILDAPDEKWYAVWDLHVMSAVRTARIFVPFMKMRGGGVILNTSSICGTQPLWYEPIYNTTKAALNMLDKCLANELVSDNIRVNTVSPGLILTDDWRKTAGILAEKEGISPKEYLDRVASDNTPMLRFATPEELASTYVFLASERSSYTLGANIFVDGGWLKTI